MMNGSGGGARLRVSLSLLLPNMIIALHMPRIGQPHLKTLRPSALTMLTRAEEQVERAWRAKLTACSPERSMEVSKQAWEAMLDDQMWTDVVTTASAQVMAEAEGAAKLSWLTRLEAPTWGAVAAAVAEVAARVDEPEPREREAREAKRVWLARLDAASWSTGAATLIEVAGDAAAMQAMQEGCDCGTDGACERYDQEEAAMRARLGRMDAPTWAAVSAAVATVAVEVTLQSAAGMRAEEIGQAAWLVQLDTAAWGAQSVSLRGMDLRAEMSAEEAAIRAQNLE